MKEGRRLEYLEKNSVDRLQKMPHTKAPKFKPQTQKFKPRPRLEPVLLHWWWARKAHMLTITPRIEINNETVLGNNVEA